MSQYLRTPKKISKLSHKWRDFLFLGLGIGLLIVPMLLIAAKQNNLVSVGYEISRLRRETEALKEERTKLRAEKAELTRPDKVWKKASEMGLELLSGTNRIEVRRLRPDDGETPLGNTKMVAQVQSEP